jgi:hypothetical protein
MSDIRTRARNERFRPVEAKQKLDASSGYFPPGNLLLQQLGVSAADLRDAKVQVNGPALGFLIAAFARRVSFDPDYYAQANPDVEGARLAGDVPSLYAHFLTAGYLEGRLPSELAFDPAWYHSHYEDIGASFRASDTEGMRDHYVTKGYFEGRAGTEAELPEAELWLSGSIG